MLAKRKCRLRLKVENVNIHMEYDMFSLLFVHFFNIFFLFVWRQKLLFYSSFLIIHVHDYTDYPKYVEDMKYANIAVSLEQAQG